MKTVMGIDPGLHGGIAIIRDGNVSARPMPVIEGDISGIRIWNMLDRVDLVIMEKVSAMPKQGVTSMFHFGVGYGMIQGLITASKIPLRLVTPQAWKKEILAGTSKDKAAAIEYVTRVFPDVNLIPDGKRKPQDGIADAVCIAEYGYRVFG